MSPTNTLAHINRYSRRYFPHQREREGGRGGSGRRTCLSTHLFFLHDFLQHEQLPGQERESRGHGQLQSDAKHVSFWFTRLNIQSTVRLHARGLWSLYLLKHVSGISSVCVCVGGGGGVGGWTTASGYDGDMSFYNTCSCITTDRTLTLVHV